MKTDVQDKLNQLIGDRITKLSRRELSKNKVEQIIFRRELVIEYVNEVKHITGSTVSTARGYRAFTKGIRNYIRGRAGGGKGGAAHAINIEKNSLVITSLPRVAGFEQGGTISKAITQAKRDLIKALIGTMTISAADETRILNAADGHHGDVIISGKKTTLGTIQALKGIDDLLVEQGIPRRENSPSIEEMVVDLATYSQANDWSKIYDIGLNTLADWLEVSMGWDQNPKDLVFKKIVPKSRQLGQKISWSHNVVPVTPEIQIVFGLSPIGRKAEYREAMSAWDAGRSGGLADTINTKVGLILTRIEKAIEMWGIKNAYDLTNLGGSPSPIDVVKTVVPRMVVGSLFDHTTRADMRFKVNKTLFSKNQGMTRNKVTQKVKTGRGLKGVKRGIGVGKAVRTRGKNHVEQAAGTNPMALKALLNEVLPAQVALNMKEPALRFRTGRFANSVRVDNVLQGPRGGNTMIETSYQNDPYETFARGGKMHTPQRDPERLIRKSVRQVATGMLGGRFGVRVL